MARSEEALVNDLLNEKAHLLSDMGVLSRPPSDSTKMEGFAKYSKLFCDSIILWGLCNGLDEKGKGIAIGACVANVRSAFNESQLDVDFIKPVGSGNLYPGTRNIFAKEDRDKLRERSIANCGAYCDGYIAIKISLADCRAKRVVAAMESILATLKTHCIVLHDIDFTRDCRYITTRMYLEMYLKEHGIRPIDDRKRVGDHCVSWMGNKEDTKNIRYKIYNKFVQMLESAEVRKSLGSRMDDIVAKDGSISKRLLRHKNHGFSRLELTFYGTDLLDISTYRERVDEAVKLFSKCTTFDCSFEMQWTQRAKCIVSMMAIYIPKKRLFAYCHWWNSVTSKKCGYIWKKVSRDVAGVLLANYSFNDRPIHYFEANMNKNSISVTNEKTYRRIQGSTAKTLVPGGNKGMYPSRESFGNGVRKFSEIGIVEVDNITIEWPKRRYNKNSVPLAHIIEIDDDDNDDRYVKKLKRISSSAYVAAQSALEEGEEYTIVAARYTSYRGQDRWHFVTKCGLRIRAGNSLTKIWDRWRRRFADDNGRMEIEWTEWMKFMAIRTTRSRGVDDIKCELVE